MRQRHWTLEEVEFVKRGKPVPGRTPVACRTKRQRVLQSKEHTPRPPTARIPGAKPPFKGTPASIERARKLRREGHSVSAIAYGMGCSYSSVREGLALAWKDGAEARAERVRAWCG